jgi:hypothetical protein
VKVSDQAVAQAAAVEARQDLVVAEECAVEEGDQARAAWEVEESSWDHPGLERAALERQSRSPHVYLVSPKTFNGIQRQLVRRIANPAHDLAHCV